MTLFGVHVGLQHTTPDELRTVWRRVEDLGFGWISVWDHFYGATGKPDDAACLEAVSMHAALACSTSKVRCGSLVYSVGYRHPAVLAKAITAIDLLSGGRAEMGIGAGWAKVEYDAYGIEFPGAKVRLDQLEEAIQCLRGLLHDDVTDFAGDYFTLTNARNEPRPVQAKLPIWVGGGGEKRTLKIAAKYADGWNVPFIGPDVFAHKRAVLHRRKFAALSTSGLPPTTTTFAISSVRSPTSSVRAFLPAATKRSSTASASTSMPAPTSSTSRCAPHSTSNCSSGSAPP
jgi:alkanesulfonate monooxygenase SsuD/methylene tetrahydromethanopterin reductase-like flavin-dependent oxidoreductase (luciferase family)